LSGIIHNSEESCLLGLTKYVQNESFKKLSPYGFKCIEEMNASIAIERTVTDFTEKIDELSMDIEH